MPSDLLRMALNNHGGKFMHSHKYPKTFVFTDGRVFSSKSMRVLKGIRCGKYLAVQIENESGMVVRKYIHRLVLELSTGIVPDDLEARHMDGNADNNSASNLQWGSRSENAADRVRHGTTTTGERHHCAKLTDRDVLAIRANVASGASQRSQCAIYGVTPMTISRAVRGECWGHL